MGWEMTHKIAPPVVGGLPVRLTTHVGDQINVLPGETPEQLKERVERAMKEMIADHQVKEGGVGRAIMERLGEKRPLAMASGLLGYVNKAIAAI